MTNKTYSDRETVRVLLASLRFYKEGDGGVEFHLPHHRQALEEIFSRPSPPRLFSELFRELQTALPGDGGQQDGLRMAIWRVAHDEPQLTIEDYVRRQVVQLSRGLAQSCEL